MTTSENEEVDSAAAGPPPASTLAAATAAAANLWEAAAAGYDHLAGSAGKVEVHHFLENLFITIDNFITTVEFRH